MRSAWACLHAGDADWMRTGNHVAEPKRKKPESDCAKKGQVSEKHVVVRERREEPMELKS